MFFDSQFAPETGAVIRPPSRPPSCCQRPGRDDGEAEAAGPASGARHDAPRSGKEVGGGGDGPAGRRTCEFDKSSGDQREEVGEAEGGCQ